MTVPLIDGTGRAVVNNLKTLKSGTKPPYIADGNNALAYGEFESANYTAEWTLTNGAVRSNAQARTGSYSLSLPATGGTGVIPDASAIIPVKPGQYVYGCFWYKVLNITGTSGTFYCEINWLDKGNNVLGGTAQLVATTDVTSWTLLTLNFLSPAPKGAVSFRVTLSLFGAASGTPAGYIDDIVLTAC